MLLELIWWSGLSSIYTTGCYHGMGWTNSWWEDYSADEKYIRYPMDIVCIYEGSVDFPVCADSALVH